MKRMTLTALVWFVAFSLAGGDCVAPADDITLVARTIYNDGNMATPDSVRIIITLDGTERSDAWYNSVDVQCNSANDALVFFDQFQDIDGAGGDGVYSVEIGAYDADSTLYTWYYYTFTVGIHHPVDLGDVSGTLDNDEIGADFLTAAKISANAIGASELGTGCIGAAEIQDNAITSAKIAADAITQEELSANAAGEIADSVWGLTTRAITGGALTTPADYKATGFSTHSTADVADAVWDEVLSDHTGAGSAGDIIVDSIDAKVSATSAPTVSQIADAVWDEPAGDHTTPNTFGDTLGQNILQGGMISIVRAMEYDVLDANAIKPGAIWGHHFAASAFDSLGKAIWREAARTLTAFDEDDMAIDLNATTVGNVGTINSLSPPANWNTLTIANNSVRADVRYWEGANVDSAASGYPDLSQSEIELADNAITDVVFATGAINANAIETDAIGSSELAATAVDEIVDAVWDEILNTHTIAGSVGDVLLDSLDAVVSSAGGTASISDADMAAIADSVWQTDTASHNGTMGSYGEILADESFVQGGTSPPTASQIADAVWDEAAGGHTVSSTYGKYLDTEVSGIGSGSGMYSVTVQAYDSSLGESIPNSRLAVRNFDQTALLGIGVTDSQGRAGLNLDADSFLVVSIATGYMFTGWDTLVVTGSSVDTVFGSRFDPGTPASPELCRVHGYVVDVQGDSETGATVSAYLPRGVMLSGSLVVSPYMVSTQTDSLGYFYLDLIPSDSLTGEDTRYEISISRQDGTILRKRISVPATTNWQLVW